MPHVHMSASVRAPQPSASSRADASTSVSLRRADRRADGCDRHGGAFKRVAASFNRGLTRQSYTAKSFIGNIGYCFVCIKVVVSLG